MIRLHLLSLRRSLVLLSGVLALAGGSRADASAAPSSTTLSATASSVAGGSPVILTASVTAGGVPNNASEPSRARADAAASAAVTPGVVLFCDANAASCQGAGLLGTAQLTANGTATFTRVLSIGSHSIKAVFKGTHNALTSTSTPVSVTVTGANPTGTLLSSTGSAGAYTLNATVGYMAVAAPGSGESVNLIDTTNNNLSLGTAPVGTASAAAYAFTTGTPFSSGSVPVEMTSADLDGDGIPDVVIANYTANTVTLFKGSSTGSYSALGSPITVGTGPVFIRSGDVNSDGIVDLVVLNAGDSTFTVLLGTGAGAFVAKPAVSTLGSGPASIAMLDANGDGIADLAVINQLSSTLSIFLGNNDGTFTATSASPVSTGGNPSAIVAADFNNDGLLDLAFTNTYDGTASVLTSNGDGTFTGIAGSPFNVTAAPSALVTGDFDGDGKRDLAVLDAGANMLTVLLNKNLGTAATPPTLRTGANPVAGVSGDFNGDGKQDIAVTNASDGTVTIFFGDGTGLFPTATQQLLNSFSAPQAIAALDINGDGLTDLAVTNLGSNAVILRDLTVAQMATAALTAVTVYGGGTHQVMASYPGDVSYASSTSGTVALTGSLIATTSTLFVSPSTTVAYGATVQLTNTINPGTSNNYTATGTVTFVDSSAATTNAAGVANGQGVASWNTLAIGPHLVTTSYSGDGNFAASASAGALITVTKAATMTTLTTASNTITPGASDTLKATVTPLTTGTPTGTASFYDGQALLGTAPLTGGIATYQTSAFLTGAHALTAVYNGDANYIVSTSAASSVAVAKVVTTIALTAAPNPVAVNGPVSFTATVSSAAATGTVTFYDGTSQIAVLALINGSAAYTTATLAVGVHSITALYAGDTTFATSTSAAVAEVVNDFTIATPTAGVGTSSSTQTALPGSTATYVLNVAPVGGGAFPLPVTLSVSGLPPGATATLTPTMLPAGSSLTNVILSIQLPKTTARLQQQRIGRLLPAAALALLLLPFSGRLRRRSRALAGTLTLLLLLAGTTGLAGLAGCSGGSGYFGQQAQSYTVTITATSGSISRSTTITLVVL